MNADSEARFARGRANGHRLGAVYQTSFLAAVTAMVFLELPAGVEGQIVRWLSIDVVLFSVSAIVVLVLRLRSGHLKIYSFNQMAYLLVVLFGLRPIRQCITPIFLLALYSDGRTMMFAAYVILTIVSQYLLLQSLAPAYLATDS